MISAEEEVNVMVEKIFRGVFAGIFCGVMGTILAVEKIRQLCRTKIDDYRIFDQYIEFYAKGKCVFTLKKYDKYSIFFEKNIIRFSYFGCGKDWYEFRFSEKLQKSITSSLHPSCSPYERGSYVF